MKFNEPINAMLALAADAGLTAYYDDMNQCVQVEMDWGDGETILEPVYEVCVMMDLVGN